MTKNTECVLPTNMLLAMNCPRWELTPGEDDTSYRDTLDTIHETMRRAMVHNIDGLTTRNTGCVFTTNRLLATNYPRLKMTPGDYDTSYGGTRIGGDLHDTVAISEGHTRRKDEDILRRSFVSVEVDIPADMNCTVVELSDLTILRRRLPQGEDSAEHRECCISIPNTAVEFNDVVFRQWRLPRTEVKVWIKSVLYQGQIRIGLSASQNCHGGLFSPIKTGTVVIPEETLRCPNRVTTYTAGGVCHRTEPERISVG